MRKKLYRNTKDGMLGGVCAGLADYFNVDVTLVRIIFVALIATGTSFVYYLIAWFLIPAKQ